MSSAYYAITGTTSDSYELDDEAERHAKSTWLCCGCTRPKINSQLSNLRCQHAGKNVALNGISGRGVGVIREDFIELLARCGFAHEIKLYVVLDKNGLGIDGFHAFLPRQEVIIRGGTRSTYRWCDICGRFLYHPLDTWYLLRSNFPDRGIFGNQFRGLIVPDDVASQIKEMKWKHVGITKLPLLDRALDNLELPVKLGE
jgi:hypothetical protein